MKNSCQKFFFFFRKRKKFFLAIPPRSAGAPSDKQKSSMYYYNLQLSTLSRRAPPLPEVCLLMSGYYLNLRELNERNFVCGFIDVFKVLATAEKVKIKLA